MPAADYQMFHVQYELKPYGSFAYYVQAMTKTEARRVADSLFRLEGGGAKARKITVKELK